MNIRFNYFNLLVKLFLTNSFAEANYDNVSVVVVNRPPLQYQVKPEPEHTFNPVIIGSIIAAMIILLTILLLLWRQLSNKKSATNLVGKPVDDSAE